MQQKERCQHCQRLCLRPAEKQPDLCRSEWTKATLSVPERQLHTRRQPTRKSNCSVYALSFSPARSNQTLKCLTLGNCRARWADVGFKSYCLILAWLRPWCWHLKYLHLLLGKQKLDCLYRVAAWGVVRAAPDNWHWQTFRFSGVDLHW